MITAYTDYFKNFAERHPDLNHADNEGEKAFFSIDFRELLSSFRNGIREKGLALYSLNFQSRFEQLGIERAEGGFVVMEYFDRNVEGAKASVYASTNDVVLSLIAEMQKDSDALHPLWKDSFQTLESFDKVPYQYEANSNYIGWLVTFNWKYVHEMRDYLID